MDNLYVCTDCDDLIFQTQRYLSDNPFCPCCGSDEYTKPIEE